MIVTKGNLMGYNGGANQVKVIQVGGHRLA